MKFKNALWVFFISMVPLIELRGAIPVGTVLELPFYINFAVAIIGNLLPIPFILLLIPKILDIMESFSFLRPIVRWVRDKARRTRAKILPEAESDGAVEILDEYGNRISSPVSDKMNAGVFLGLLTFVLIPLPGTGAWTGALVASLFEFPKFKSFLAISLGVLGCAVIMCLASYGILGFLSFLA